MANPSSNNAGSKDIISIVLVDDIAETRENIKKLLAFESDFKVVGSAGTGREAVELAKELHPNIIIMDINMPDMDGLQATTKITEAVPTSAVIMMSVQNDADYLRRAMLAGARDFLTKPVDMDELYNTIRAVHERNKPLIAQYKAAMEGGTLITDAKPKPGGGDRAGHIVVVYSPQGGSGKTTIATSLASGLMKEGIKVLLVDGSLQFGDLGVFLNLQAQSTILDLIDSVEDLDTELFDNIVTPHESGLKILMGPARPELADEIIANNPGVVSKILEKVAGNYDFIIVDTASNFDQVLVPLLDLATKIVLVGTPTLPSIKNVRFVLDLFDQLGYPQDKAVLILNRTWDPRQGKQAMLTPDRIQTYLKRAIEAQIPYVDERFILSAINKGVPVIAADRDQNKPPIKQLVEFSELLFTKLMGEKVEEGEEQPSKDKKRAGLFGR